MRIAQSLRLGLGVLGLALLSGCVTLDHEPVAEDPFESFNRGMYMFNNDLDRALVRPLAEAYNEVMPTPVNQGVSNVFENLRDVGSAVSNGLQFKFTEGASDVGRVLVNSTLGIGGVFDVASHMGLPKHDEDFGQVLGYWGMGPGPYLVLPVIGPSTIRDTVGFAVDWYLLDPLYLIDDDSVRWSLYTLRFIDTRADLIVAGKVMESAALDPYSFVRDAYLQRRQYQVTDGASQADDLWLEPEAGQR